MEQETTLEEKQLVVFKLADETYGVEISQVHEIIRMQDITKVPRTADFIEGVINLRGNVIPVIDLRKRFLFQEREDTSSTRIIIIEVENYTVGMIVDSVLEVAIVTTDSIEPPSNIITDIDSDYLLGVCKMPDKLIILLDLSKVLTSSEKQKLENIT